MIQIRSILKVADNSGAKFVRVFTILGGSRKRYAQVGEIVIASVQSAEPRKAIKKKDKVRCLIIRQRHPLRRPDGTAVRFDDNAVIIVDEKKEPKGTRVFGPMPREIKDKGFETVFGQAEEVV